ARYADTSAGFIYDARTTHPDSCREVYILVIGETARADNFGLFGYSRDTTPLLSSTEGLITYPKAFTQSNTTHKSVPMLLSAASAEDYNRIYREKGIITAFKEAGFHTTFISNQRPNHSFIDFFGKEADSWEFLKEELPESANVPDGDMTGLVKKILDGGHMREFIVLHTYGSHFKYRERYPHDIAEFLPDEASEATPDNRCSLINAYDNSILYTDRFLHTLITELKESRTESGLIYASDHGENIFDDERGLFLHASPRPSIYELHVPMMIWLSDEYRERYPDIHSELLSHSEKQVITSLSVFHTTLHIAGINTRHRIDSLSLASAHYHPAPYNYLSDRNIPVPVSKIIRK
ncbi:phosphoethanolamine transferase, partial [uncultured Duncaniella sp.]